MHSRIFHIMPSAEEVLDNKKSYDDYTLESVGADYIVETESWEDDIDWLMTVLPKDMFAVEKIVLNVGTENEERYAKLTYANHPTEYLEKWISDIKEYTKDLSVEKLKDWYSRWNFADLVRKNGIAFYIDLGGDYPDLTELHDWIISVSNHNNIGDTFYIGSIMDYHS